MNNGRILLITQNWLGDVLFATPAIRAIRKKYPEAHIACLVTGRVRAVLKNNPHVNELIEYRDRAPILSLSFWRAVISLARGRFDTAIFFHPSASKARLARWSQIKERWGYATPKRINLLTRAVVARAEPTHRIDYFLNLIEALGIPADGRLMDFYPDHPARAEIDTLLSGAGIGPQDPYVVVHTGGNWALKRWPSDYFSQWIYYFYEKYGWKVILCGSASEQPIAARILSKLKNRDVVSFCGKTSLDALAFLLRDARLFVSNDSGPVHLAASQGTKILGLFGPTSPHETGPVSAAPVKILRKDVGCRIPCYFKSCNYRVCMDFLLPAEAFERAQELLNAP